MEQSKYSYPLHWDVSSFLKDLYKFHTLLTSPINELNLSFNPLNYALDMGDFFMANSNYS